MDINVSAKSNKQVIGFSKEQLHGLKKFQIGN